MELRKDYILDRWVFLASGRKSRPREFKKIEVEHHSKELCFFCPGNEHLTPPEIGRVEEKGRWKIRWFPNKFPAVEQAGNPIIQTHNDFFTFASAYGKHEVIAECQEHHKQLWDLPVEHLNQILQVYKSRVNALLKENDAKYVILFKNHGREAGTSLMHSHTQAASVNLVPAQIREEVEASKKQGNCQYCKIINIEKGSDRRCFENESFTAFAPYASRFNYEIWIFSKKHAKTFNDFNEKEIKDMAEILNKILLKLKEINVPYNFFFHYAPAGEDLHFHIEVTPRLATWAGFEFASNAIINSVTPEYAAEFYRDKLVAIGHSPA